MSSDFIMERHGSSKGPDRSFDVEYWQRQGKDAIFKAAREMVIEVYKANGWPLDDGIQRHIEAYGRKPQPPLP